MTLMQISEKAEAGKLTLKDVIAAVNSLPSKKWEALFPFVKKEWNSAVKGAMYRRAKKNA